MEQDPTSGERRDWPVKRDELEIHYERAEHVLDAQQYPSMRKPYSGTLKTREFIAAAEELRLKLYLPNLAVTFAGEGEEPGEPIREPHNIHGVPCYTCRLVGECDIGCNYGSKNTLDLTYLSEAAKWPNVDIRCLCEVRSFEPCNGRADDSEGYTVHYVKHKLDNEGKRIDTHDPNILPLQTILDKLPILSAGTLGSTFLLLKMREQNPRPFSKLSPQLGKRFGGNGDIVMLATKAKDSASGKRKPRILDPGYGPVITSTVHVRASEDGGKGRGHYVQDGGYPDFMNWNLQATNTPLKAVRYLRFFLKWLNRNSETDMSAEASKLFGKAERSSSLLPLLGMGRDVPEENMKLREGKLNVDWQSKESYPYFLETRSTMRSLAGKLEARLWDIPLWWLSRYITVHPLGGCPMGRNDTEGVVNSYGIVFNYDRLYVADGSVMLGPVGSNPSLTIAALADRFADGVIDECKGENA